MYKPAKKILISGPSITQREVEYVARAVKNGWNENYIKYVSLFEKKFSLYVKRKFALATSSCTGALHLAYLSIGIKCGDEVIVPNISWVASIEPLYYIGAKPVFIDITKDSWCIDPSKIEEKITKKTKAILIVNLYGHVAEINTIYKIASKYGLKIVEDAAESIGSEYYGRKSGSFGDISCFSFHGSKTLVTGEGGMLLTDDENIITKARYYNDHCKARTKLFWTLEVGYKYKMSNFQAACGLAQLERIESLINKKIKIFSWYKKRLSRIKEIQLNVQKPKTKNSYWMVTVIFDKKYGMVKEKAIEKFKKYGITVRPFFYPLSSLPFINEKVHTPVSFDISQRAINLPCGLNIKKTDVDLVCNILIKRILRINK